MADGSWTRVHGLFCVAKNESVAKDEDAVKGMERIWLTVRPARSCCGWRCTLSAGRAIKSAIQRKGWMAVGLVPSQKTRSRGYSRFRVNWSLHLNLHPHPRVNATLKIVRTL
jgi:hypothetical protein